jgi:FkbM family methyltransferase
VYADGVGESKTSFPGSGDARVNSEAAQNDQPFRHYSLRHRAVAWISQTLFDRYTYTVRHGLIQGMKRKGGLGWLPESVSSQSETKEHAFWRTINLKGLVVYDIGCFHGILTLFFARQSRQVIGYEPNTRNYTRLMDNIQLNALQNVKIRKLGVGSESRKATLVFTPLMTGGGTLEPKAAEQIKKSNMASVAEQIEITTLDEDIAAAALPPPDFIKIDIEGWELEALRGAGKTLAAHKPALFLEMHGETMNEKKRKVAEIVDYLNQAGYQNILHVETGIAIHRTNTSVAAQGHLYCTQ